MPWTSPGCTGNRGWPYAPSPSILAARWNSLVGEPDHEVKTRLFKETRDRKLGKLAQPLPGAGTSQRTVSIDSDGGTVPTPVRVGYRSFDRQWVIPDSRLLDMPRPNLWAARVPGQLFVVELHSEVISDGPGLVFSSLIPDLHHFKGSQGGRTLPMLHPDGSGNTTPGLMPALATLLGVPVTAQDLSAYVGAVVAHPGFTRRFTDELTTPGIQVPLTSDPELWSRALDVGRRVVRLHTYGATFADKGAGRPEGNVRFPQEDPRQPQSLSPVTVMPAEIAYDAASQVLALGDGQWGPVNAKVWEYSVGGKNVLKSWFNYRKAVPGGKKTSPLDYVHLDLWPPEWTTELIDLLTVLTRLVDLEAEQGNLLADILAGAVLTADGLVGGGVRWPAGPSDRKPRYGLPGEQHTMDI